MNSTAIREPFIIGSHGSVRLDPCFVPDFSRPKLHLPYIKMVSVSINDKKLFLLESTIMLITYPV